MVAAAAQYQTANPKRPWGISVLAGMRPNLTRARP